MASVVTASSIASLNSSMFTSTGPNWLADTFTAIKNDQNQAGLLGMLQNSGGDGSVSSFLSQSSSTANNFALISQNNVASASSLVSQIAAQNQQTAASKKLQDALNSLNAQQQMVSATNVLDPVIYLSGGVTIDTANNIMTMPDGTQYDTTTGAKYVDPASLIQMANGAYLNTQSNILTMPDGTQVDVVTGLKVSVTA